MSRWSNGVAYGEPYESAVAELTVQGKDIEASHVVLKLHGMQIAGNGGYDLGSEHLHGHIEGHNLVLSKFETVKTGEDRCWMALLSVVADANGTLTEPGLKANVKLDECDVSRDRESARRRLRRIAKATTVYFTANSTLVGAKLDGTGQMETDGRLSDAGEADDGGAGYRQAAGDVWAGNDEGAVADRWRGDGERAAEDAEGAEWRGGVQQVDVIQLDVKLQGDRAEGVPSRCG